MKSVRLILAITVAAAFMAGVSWAKDHSACPGKQDSTAVCQKTACDSMDMSKCKDAQMKGCCKKDSMSMCQKAMSDSTDMAKCKDAHMKGCSKKGEKPCGAIEQTTCPVMGGPINEDIFIEHNGKKVYFCCEQCKAEYLKDPDKYPLKK